MTRTAFTLLALGILAGCVDGPPTGPTGIPAPDPNTTVSDFVGQWTHVDSADGEYVAADITATGSGATVELVQGSDSDCTTDCEISFAATFADYNLNGEHAFSSKVVTFTIIYDDEELSVVGVHNYTDDSGRDPHTSVDRMRRYER